MRKLTLALDDLTVESFSTEGGRLGLGTVRGNADTDDCTEAATCITCTCANPCTSDGEATIDAQLCGTAYATACGCGGSGQTVNALSCANTGICCGGHSIYSRCC